MFENGGVFNYENEFPFKSNQQKKLDPSYKTGLDFSDWFE